MMHRHTLIIFSVYLLLHSAIAHKNVDHSVQYHVDNFPREIEKENHFVMFYVPWCVYYKQFAPTWEILARMMYEDEKKVRIAHIDCSTDYLICTANNVNKSPSLLFFKPGVTTRIEFTGKTRDLPSLKSFIDEQLGNGPEISVIQI